MKQLSLSLRLCDFLATGFYSGKAPIAPGTWGSAAAMVLIWALCMSFPVFGTLWGSLSLALGLTLLGLWVCSIALKHRLYGEEEDPKQIVIDEFAGYAVSIIGASGNITHLVLGFALFRLFDISKPPPVRQLESFPKGLGIMLDDVMAGFYALIAVKIILALI